MANETPQTDPSDRSEEKPDSEQTTSLSIGTGSQDTKPGGPSHADNEPIPDRIDRYKVIRLLGEGGFGRVYLARDERLEKDFAIKVAKKPELGAQTVAETYLAEARNLARLEHPHIIQVYDVRVDDVRPYIVMKYVDGLTFEKWVSTRRPSIHEIVRALTAVCEALGFAHRHDLVHRDLKPSNILIDQEGRPHVTDFGLALHFDARREWQGRVAGTLPYMSPEQVRGEAHRIDGRSDIWSFGVLLYEQLAGSRPFAARDTEKLLDDISSVDPPPPRQRNPSIPPELERICLKCLEKRRSDRYSTVSDLIEDLKHWLAAPQPLRQPKESAPHAPEGATAPRVVPKGLRSFTAADADFFLDLLPGPRDRSGLPESIRFWKSKIEETNPEKTFSVGLIYGPSGCGKSSLVLAGLIPRIAEHVTTLYVEATPGETELRLRRGIQKLFTEHSAKGSLPEVFARLRQTNSTQLSDSESSWQSSATTFDLHSRPPGKVVVFLDQFEQWLHAFPDAHEVELIQALRQCDGAALQAVLMVRDDFAMAAARFMAALDVPILQGHNFATIDLFDVQHAEKILRRFGQAYGQLPENSDKLTTPQRQFVSSAIRGLATAGAVVPVRLALLAEMVKSKPWSPATLEEVGGTTGIGVNFLEETFCSRSANPRYRYHEEAARNVLRALLPELGVDIKRHMRPREQLQKAAGYEDRSQDFDEVLRILDSELRLITPTDPEGIVSDGAGHSHVGNYQLAHDYLVPALQTWLSRRQKQSARGRAELRLAERESLWSSKPVNQQLPPLWEYVNIGLLSRRAEWTAAQGKMMKAARRYYFARILAATVVLVLLGWGAFEMRGRIRARSLVDTLASASEDKVLEVIAHLKSVGHWARPMLQEAAEAAEAEPGGKDDWLKRFNARLALVSDGSPLIDELKESMLTGPLKYVGCIRQSLEPYRHDIVEGLWRDFRNTTMADDRRFRAGIALVDYDTTSTQWTDEDYLFLARQLVTSDPESQPRLREWLSALQVQLVPPLVNLFHEAGASERQQAGTANALAEFAGKDQETIVALLCDATILQYKLLFQNLATYDPALAKVRLIALAASAPAPETSTTERLAMGRRRANAAMALIQSGKRDGALNAFRIQDDPEPISQFALNVRQQQVSAGELIESLYWVSDKRLRQLFPDNADSTDVNDDNSPLRLETAEERRVRDRIRFAFLLALGEYSIDEILVEQRQELLDRLAEWFDSDPSSAIHGMTGWLLRKWGMDKDVRRLEELPKPYDPKREWFRTHVNNDSPAGDSTKVEGTTNPAEGTFTFVVFAAGEYTLGSPEDESEREPREKLQTVTISRPFAVLDREITFADMASSGVWQRAANPESAAAGPNWYEAVWVCRKLSEKAGIPEEDQAYPDPTKLDRDKYPPSTAEGAEGAPENWPMRHDRPGFRLPTEAEWEIACRGGMRTAYGFGGDAALLVKFGWCGANDDDTKGAHHPRQLRPNLRGLFDCHGNLWEWCHDPLPNRDMGPIRDRELEIDQPVAYRVTRGGWKKDRDPLCRSANRSNALPGNRTANCGFRIAVTLPD